MSCEYGVDYNTIAGVVTGAMFVASELLALSKKTKANGIVHLILIYLEKKFRVQEPDNPEYGAVPEYAESVEGDIDAESEEYQTNPFNTVETRKQYIKYYNSSI